MEVASAIRLPTPEPADAVHNSPPPLKRKRSPSSRSPSPSRHRSKPQYSGPLPRDVDHGRAVERQRQFEMRQREEPAERPQPVTEEQKLEALKKEYSALISKRSGGTYIPPARLRALQAQLEVGDDRKSKEWQREYWNSLKKSINGLVNKINTGNIKHIVPELFEHDLIRGRGLFCRSIMKAQAASLPFSPIFAAMAAIVNTKLPQVGELLVKRLVVAFRKGFKRNDKAVCISSSTFLAHLINQQVVNEILGASILLLLLHKPTDDSVEIAVSFCKEVGQHLEEFNAPIAIAVFDQFRTILHEATDLEKRTQYMIEVLFQVRKDKYKEYPAIREELDLIEEEDQITHQVDLDGDIEVQDGLNIFKYDADFEANEEAYNKLKNEILGIESGSEEDDDEDEDDSSEGEEEVKEREMEIEDQTNTDLVNLRRTIYLTLKSSGTFEEAVHKLMRVQLPAGLEHELPSMIIESASQERTAEKFYLNIAERFCKLNRLWRELFENAFQEYYDKIHRYETNRLRIIAALFAHVLATDAIGWQVLGGIHLNEDETTSSSRIFIKILFEELLQALGAKNLVARLRDDLLQPSLNGIFPKDNPRNTRFSINFFTAINMGVVTEDMREYLKNVVEAAPPALPEPDSESDTDSVSSYSTDSRSRSRSRTPRRSDHRGRRDSTESRSRSPTPRRRRGDSTDSYDSRSRSRSRTASPPRRGNNRTADARRRRYSTSPSRSPSPRRSGRRASTSSPERSRSPPLRRDARSQHGNTSSVSRSPPRFARRNGGRRGRGGGPSHGQGRRRNTSSEDSRSPPPRRSGGLRDDSGSRSPSPPRARRGGGRRSLSSSRSRSPSRRR